MGILICEDPYPQSVKSVQDLIDILQNNSNHDLRNT